MQKTVTSPESQRNSISPLPFPEVRQSKRIIEHISKSELDLIQFFFEDIPKVLIKYLIFNIFNIISKFFKAENNCVLKSDISKYMLSNPNILELYNLNPKNLVVELNSYTTSNTNGLTLKELVQFLKTPRDIPISMSEFSKDQLKSMKQSLITDLPNVCLLTDDEINTMRNVFKDLDKAGDLTVNRKQLINALRKDIKISQILQNPAVYLPKCDKVLIFNRLLHQIEREEFYGEEINRKAKESIAWQHFISHFTNYRRVFYISRELFHKIKNKIDLRTIFDDQELLDLSPEHISYFKAAIESLEKTPENYFFLPDLLKTLKKDHKFEFLSQENARRASEKFSLPNEKIGEVLKRMEKEADDHLDWDEFLEFFTRRGRPKYFIIDKEERRRVYKLVLDEVLPGKIHTKKFKTLKKKFYIEEDQNNEEEENLYDDADSLKKENILVEGYDSDPEYQLKQAKTIALKETAFIKAKKVGFFGAMFKENIDREAFKITVPHPFSFNEREKNKIKVKSISQIKLENSLFNKDKEELEALQVRIKPQPVPKNIKDHHLWSKIRQNQEKRRLDVKKRSKAMTLQTEKPFSFLFRDKSKKEEEEIRRKTKKEREKYQFKANPIPWFSSLKLMIDPETKENERREKLARNANISLSLSRLPPRMEQYEKERVN